MLTATYVVFARQNRLVEAGHIYKGSHSGWYAVSDECFYTEQQIKDAEDGSGTKVGTMAKHP